MLRHKTICLPSRSVHLRSADGGVELKGRYPNGRLSNPTAGASGLIGALLAPCSREFRHTEAPKSCSRGWPASGGRAGSGHQQFRSFFSGLYPVSRVRRGEIASARKQRLKRATLKKASWKLKATEKGMKSLKMCPTVRIFHSFY